MSKDTPYKSTVSAFSGIVSGQEIMFEGMQRPEILMTLRETGIENPKDILILERYFVDIHNLFLKKLSTFASEGDISGLGQDVDRLRSLFEELLKIKILIQKSEVS